MSLLYIVITRQCMSKALCGQYWYFLRDVLILVPIYFTPDLLWKHLYKLMKQLGFRPIINLGTDRKDNWPIRGRLRNRPIRNIVPKKSLQTLCWNFLVLLLFIFSWGISINFKIYRPVSLCNWLPQIYGKKNVAGFPSHWYFEITICVIPLVMVLITNSVLSYAFLSYLSGALFLPDTEGSVLVLWRSLVMKRCTCFSPLCLHFAFSQLVLLSGHLNYMALNYCITVPSENTFLYVMKIIRGDG